MRRETHGSVGEWLNHQFAKLTYGLPYRGSNPRFRRATDNQ